MARKGKATADVYYDNVPGTRGLIPESQAQERAERYDIKERRFQGESVKKGIIVPELPWKD